MAEQKARKLKCPKCGGGGELQILAGLKVKCDRCNGTGFVESYTCNDCEYCGIIIAPYEEWLSMKKYCPSPYLFNHPNPQKCPNFKLKKSE